RSRSPSLGLGNNSPFHVGIGSTMTLGTRVFLLLVTLVTALRPMAAHAVGSGDCAGLVDIGGGRKIYLECHGTGSPTVVLISGTRGAHDDWTYLIDPTSHAVAQKPSESAVFPQIAKLTRVCAYDRPGTIQNDNTPTNSSPVRQP